MTELSDGPRPMATGIIDFNPVRMNKAEAKAIPPTLRDFVADKRQYPFNIARHFPDGVSWLSPDQPWFFRKIMSNPDQLAKLSESDTLILSGSGMSAYHFQEGDLNQFIPEEIEHLKKTQELIRDYLGAGKWTLGICFGGQLAVHAIGGKLGRLPTKSNGHSVVEAGWLKQRLTTAGEEDAVFGPLPKAFFAPHLHSDYVEELPAVGTVVSTSSGDITVTKAEILAL